MVAVNIESGSGIGNFRSSETICVYVGNGRRVVGCVSRDHVSDLTDRIQDTLSHLFRLSYSSFSSSKRASVQDYFQIDWIFSKSIRFHALF